MLKSEQSVEGNNNLQAGRDINQYGISYADAKEIALDIYRNQLPYMTKLASDKAWKRVEPVLNEILAQIHQKKPEAINEFAEPEVQYMLGSAMKTASSTDDHVVHDTLVRLAVDHVLSEERSYDRIVDEQAIEALQKMNQKILKSLQELAFWNHLFTAVDEENIIEYLSKDYGFAYSEHLELSGCIVKTKSTDLERLARFSFATMSIDKKFDLIRKKYGFFFHSNKTDIKKYAKRYINERFQNDICELVISKINQYPKVLQNKNLMCVPEPDILYFDIDSDYWDLSIVNALESAFSGQLKKERIQKFVSKIFFSRKQIEESIIKTNKQIENTIINDFIFCYNITKLGRCIAKHLPNLLINNDDRILTCDRVGEKLLFRLAQN